MYECFVSSRLAAAAVLDLLGGRASSLEPYEAAVDARARAAAPRLVEAQARARPLAARLLASRPHASSLWRSDRAAPPRRALAPGRAARPGAAAAAALWTLLGARPKAPRRALPTTACRHGSRIVLLRRAVDAGASDIHLKVGRPPIGPPRRRHRRARGRRAAHRGRPRRRSCARSRPRRAAALRPVPARPATSTSPTRPRSCRASASTPSASAARSRSRSA